MKRVERLIEALRLVRIQTSWTHIGDGPLMEECRRLSESLPHHVKSEFIGHLEPREVLPYLVSRPVDLFVNVSSTEGVPFSVMEALSAGVPVFATDVGGTGEIVDNRVGKLLPADIRPLALAFAFGEFQALPGTTKSELRDAAYRRYIERCDARVLSERMARFATGGHLADDLRREASQIAGTV